MSNKQRVVALLQSVEEAAGVFVGPIESRFDSEYGISDRDAQKGALALLQHLGVLSEDDARLVERRWRAVERLDDYRTGKAWEARRASMTPEQRRLEDSIARTMQTSMEMMRPMYERMFAASPLYTLAASATDEARSTVIQTSTRPGFKRAMIIEPGEAQ